MAKQITHKYGLCIDWETSGTNWNGDSTTEYQGLSCGIVVFNTETFEPVKQAYYEIQFDADKYKWSDEAEAIHGLSREYLAEHGLSQQEVAAELASIVLQIWGPVQFWGNTTRVMFLGHNPLYDIRFTNQLLNTIDIEFSVERTTDKPSWIQLHHVVLDTSALGFITMGLYKSDLLFEKIGFEHRGKHNSLQDALQTVETCAVIKALLNIT